LRATADSQGSCARVPEKVAATVPGEIHQQLHTAGILDKEILWRFETRNQTWVTFQKWTYETKFDLDKINVMEDYILQLSGVSVIANVSINGH
jgi:beta-galactosidase/beta-glucuronidase